MTDSAKLNPGSFRDPSGQVFKQNGNIYRTVNSSFSESYTFVRRSGILDALHEKQLIPGYEEVPENRWPELHLDKLFKESPSFVLKHEKIQAISYPYEWTFSQLQDAAVAHLQLQLEALRKDVALSDSAAYNMQFVRGRPVHIDLLSLVPYKEGAVWLGYNQFCRQFLYPLLLEHHTGVGFQPLLKARLEGMEVGETNGLLPIPAKLTPRCFLHVVLRAKAEKKQHRLDEITKLSRTNLPRRRLRALLEDMQHWISSMRRKNSVTTYWSDYAHANSYNQDEEKAKHLFIAEHAERIKPNLLLDLGGNTGNFSRTALRHGASSAVVIDSDIDSLEHCWHHAKNENLNILPIHMDLADPSPDRGWAQVERQGLENRFEAESVFALALIHHLAITCNIPMDYIVRWVVNKAPRGIIEFVPKSDSMVQRMLAGRKDIFPNYDEQAFRKTLESNCSIVRERRMPETGRLLIEFKR